MSSKPLDETKILFISDVHLGAFTGKKNRQLEAELIRLLDYAEEHQYRIAILGDLFDYWIEYPGWSPKLGKKLLARFQKFHQTAAPTLYITGNHDNWTLGYFEDLGFDVEPDCRIWSISDKKILMAHGDATGNPPDDLKRPLFHRLIRNETFMKFYRSVLPPRVGLQIMRLFSKASRQLSFDQTDPAALNRWAAAILEKNDIDLVLCGHDHHPRLVNYDYGTYINLGTFYHHQSLVACNKGRFSLVQWSSNRQQLNRFHPEL